GPVPALAQAPGKPLPMPGAPTVAGRPPTGPRLGAPSLAAPVEGRLTPPGGVRISALKPSAQLAGALEQMQRRQWDAARAILTALAERAPEVPRYRALLCYARGREAQLAQRVDDARVELQEALQIDPDLQLAKTALTELFIRRK